MASRHRDEDDFKNKEILDACFSKIEELEKEGHTYHCACRQVWGDGGCECNKEGYDPYAWMEEEECSRS